MKPNLVPIKAIISSSLSLRIDYICNPVT